MQQTTKKQIFKTIEKKTDVTALLKEIKSIVIKWKKA